MSHNRVINSSNNTAVYSISKSNACRTVLENNTVGRVGYSADWEIFISPFS